MSDPNPAPWSAEDIAQARAFKAELDAIQDRALRIVSRLSHVRSELADRLHKHSLAEIDTMLADVKRRNIHMVWSDELGDVRALIEKMAARIDTLEQEVRVLQQGQFAQLWRELEDDDALPPGGKEGPCSPPS